MLDWTIKNLIVFFKLSGTKKQNMTNKKNPLFLQENKLESKKNE